MVIGMAQAESQRVPPCEPRNRRQRMPDEWVWDARRLYGEGWPVNKLADKAGVSRRTMGDAIFGKGAYQDV